ncbi:MAG: hypothetical protein KF731_15295, partial [Thauera sp.]|nr:hypothetical protein [Thauera sp.]
MDLLGGEQQVEEGQRKEALDLGDRPVHGISRRRQRIRDVTRPVRGRENPRMFRSLRLIVNHIGLRRSTIMRWRRAAVRFCLPPTCLLCLAPGRCDRQGQAIDLCEACERSLPAAAAVRGAPALRMPPCDFLVAPLRYDWPIDHCVQALKFHGETAHGRLLGLLLAQARRAVTRPLPEIVLPVPLHRARYLERGYNQAAIIGECAAGALALPFGARLLERCRATAEQSHLRAGARARNVAGAFRVHPGAQLGGRRVALVDDVLTTGNTAREVARVLRAAGAADIELWVAARAAPGAPPSAAVEVIEQDADEDRQADIVVVEERTKAGGRFALADDPLLPQEEHRRRREPGPIPRAELHAAPREVQREQHHRLHRPDDQPVHVGKEQRARFHAELQVILAVDHRVERVEHHRPQHRGEEQHPAD